MECIICYSESQEGIKCSGCNDKTFVCNGCYDNKDYNQKCPTCYNILNNPNPPKLTLIAPEGCIVKWKREKQYWSEWIEKNGKKEGEYRSWYKNGKQEIISFYKDDKREGEIKCWYENGQQNIILIYEDGELVEF
jgi:antitoxin component YwqK of YwqJK toxin-antitoxin module